MSQSQKRAPVAGKKDVSQCLSDDARSKTLEDELLQLLAKQSRRVPIASFLAAFIIAFFAVDHVSTLVGAIWLIVVSVVLAVRFSILPRLPELKHRSHTNRIRIAIGLSFLNGLMFASSLIIFPLLPELERAIHSVILVALATGAVATTAGHRPIFMAFMLPSFMGMVPLWLISPGLPATGIKEAALGLLILMFGAILVGLARDAWRIFKESFNIRSEVMELNDKLSEALRNAELANNAKTRFLASASHDLRQPIHTLSLFGAALSMRQLDEQTRDIARHMNIALQNLATQLDSLLDISKLDAGVIDRNLSHVDLKSMLLNLGEEYRRLCKEKNLSLRCGLLDDLPFIHTDASLLERILRNLISNAIKYTDSGTVFITTSRKKGRIAIRISDTGRGISQHEQRHVFEEFYQVDNPERDRDKGLGLGLSIVKRLTDMLGFELSMDSIIGKGTKFELLLPTEIEIHEDFSAEEPALTEHLPSNKSRILVIDDESGVRAGMESLLSSIGYVVDLAESTTEAVDLARKNTPDLVLADLRLRGTDTGIESIHTIRAFLPGVPSLLISGDTAPSRLQAAQLAGIEMLHKPVDVDVLQRRIHSLCSNSNHDSAQESKDVRARA